MPDRTYTSLTSTECAVLGLLARHGEHSGYDLRKAIERSVGYFWAPARSQIYAVLPRLVDAGLVTGRAVEQTHRPDKHLYRLTQAGRGALEAWLVEPVEPEPDRNVFLLKLFFGEHAGVESLLEHVRRRRGEALELRAELEALNLRAAGRDNDFYPGLTRAYGLAWADAVARWADEAEQRLVGELAHGTVRS